MTDHLSAIEAAMYINKAGVRIETLLRAPWKYLAVPLGHLANGADRDLSAVDDGLRHLGDAHWELAASVPWGDDVLLIFKQRDAES
jgi:hypothetical protein